MYNGFRMAVNAEANKESFRAKNMSAFVLGATGEVGKELLKQIVRSKVFQRVVLIGRRNVDYSSDPELMDLVRQGNLNNVGNSIQINKNLGSD